MNFLQNLVIGIVIGVILDRLTRKKQCQIVSTDFDPALNQVTATFADGSSTVIDLAQPTPEAPPVVQAENDLMSETL